MSAIINCLAWKKQLLMLLLFLCDGGNEQEKTSRHREDRFGVNVTMAIPVSLNFL